MDMKKGIICFTVIFSLTTYVTYGQIQLLKDTLIKKTERNVKTGKLNVRYFDGIWIEDELSLPKDANENTVEIVDEKLSSIEKLNSIVSHVFTDDEIRYLDSNKCYISCWVLSSGRIVSASISFRGHDPNVDLKKLIEFSDRIKKELSFKLSFDKSVKDKGYIYLSFPAFQALLRPGSLKGYCD